MAYVMTWKDITIILNQTLSDTDIERVKREAKKFADGLHLSDTKYPTGETAVPSTDPGWDYNQKEHQWERNHFIICIKAGLKAAQHKVINYSQVTAISQEPGENLTAFLHRLREAFIKYTNLDLDSYESQVIIKDKFLTQHLILDANYKNEFKNLMSP